MTDTKHTLPKGVWIEHTPGECPVPDDTMVLIELRDGYATSYYHDASGWVWGEDYEGTIVRYMIEPDDDAPDELTRLRAQNAALVDFATMFLGWREYSSHGEFPFIWLAEAARAALAQAESDQ